LRDFWLADRMSSKVNFENWSVGVGELHQKKSTRPPITQNEANKNRSQTGTETATKYCRREKTTEED
jgi:hypothetical protein